MKTLLSYQKLAANLMLAGAMFASAQEPAPPPKTGEAAAKEEAVVLKVTSAMVRDAQNQIFGKVEEIVVDPASGKIEFAFVANAINTNVISKITPVPWRLLTARSERVGPFGSPGVNQVLQVNMDREKLMKAPAFDRRKWPDMTKKDWAHPYLTYYGLEAGPEKKETSQ
jgi:hypothetical protein